MPSLAFPLHTPKVKVSSALLPAVGWVEEEGRRARASNSGSSKLLSPDVSSCLGAGQGARARVALGQSRGSGHPAVVAGMELRQIWAMTLSCTESPEKVHGKILSEEKRRKRETREGSSVGSKGKEKGAKKTFLN